MRDEGRAEKKSGEKDRFENRCENRFEVDPDEQIHDEHREDERWFAPGDGAGRVVWIGQSEAEHDCLDNRATVNVP